MAKTVAALLDASRVAQIYAFNPPHPHGATQPRFLGGEVGIDLLTV